MASYWQEFAQNKRNSTSVLDLHKGQNDNAPCKAKSLGFNDTYEVHSSIESSKECELSQKEDFSAGSSNDYSYVANQSYESRPRAKVIVQNSGYSKWDLMRPRSKPNITKLKTHTAKKPFESNDITGIEKNYAVNTNNFSATIEDNIHATDTKNNNTSVYSVAVNTDCFPKVSTSYAFTTPIAPSTACIADTSITQSTEQNVTYPNISTAAICLNTVENTNLTISKKTPYSMTSSVSSLTDKGTNNLIDTSIDSFSDIKTCYPTVLSNVCLSPIDTSDYVKATNNPFEDFGWTITATASSANPKDAAFTDDTTSCPGDTKTFYSADTDTVYATEEIDTCFTNRKNAWLDEVYAPNVNESIYEPTYCSDTHPYHNTVESVRYNRFEMLSMCHESDSKRNTEGIMASLNICKLIVMGSYTLKERYTPKNTFYVPERQPSNKPDSGKKGFTQLTPISSKGYLLTCPVCKSKAA